MNTEVSVDSITSPVKSVIPAVLLLNKIISFIIKNLQCSF